MTLQRSDFVQLFLLLRARGYEFGIEEVLQSIELTQSKQDRIQDLKELGQYISPIACKSVDQQRRFLTDWAEVCIPYQKVETLLPDNLVARRQEAAERRLARIRLKARLKWIRAIGVAGALLAIITFAYLQPDPDADRVKEEIIDVPAPIEPISLPDLPQTEAPVLQEQVELPLPPSEATLYQRLSAEAYKNWAALQQLVPIGILLALLTWLMTRFAVAQTTRQANTSTWKRKRVRLEALRLDEIVEPLMTSSWHGKAIKQLRGYRLRKTEGLDVKRTVDRAIELNGYFEPVRTSVPEIIEYIALIERTSPRDHFTRYAEALVDVLRRADIQVATGYFTSSLERIWIPEITHSTISISELSTIRPNHRILIFSDGDALVSNETFEFHSWAQTLKDRDDLGVLTHAPPQDWSAVEWRLRAFGSNVFSADGLGLERLGASLSTGQMVQPHVLYGAPNLPDILADIPTHWTQSDRPPASKIRQLTTALKSYLGPDDFRWLCAMAIYPILSWELTTFLGSRLSGSWSGDKLGVERRLLNVCRLPWLRSGTMPAWLRWHLMSQLTKKERLKVRGQLACLIDAAQRSDNPEAPRIAIREVDEIAPLIDAEEIDAFIEPNVQGPLSDFSDYIFVNTLKGRRPRKLEILLPTTLRGLFVYLTSKGTAVAATLVAATTIGLWFAAAPGLRVALETIVHERRDEVLRYTNALHSAWVASAGEVSERQSYQDRDLRKVDWSDHGILAQLDVSGSDLTEAKLDGVNLMNAIAEQVNLTNATLVGANLEGINLSGALLVGADLSGANLQSANLIGVDVEGALFNGTNVSGIDLNRLLNLSAEQISGACTDFLSDGTLGSQVTLPQCPESETQAIPTPLQPPYVASLSEINVAYFLEWPLPFLFAKQTGLYDQALPGTTINWISFDTGVAMSAAMASGDVQISMSQGLPPFVVAVASGQEIQMIDVAVNYSDNDNCVVASELGINRNNAEQLAGKRIAVPLGTSAHYGFLRQMDFFGVSLDSVEIIDMAPAEGEAALAAGTVQMACGWGGALRRMKEVGNVLLTAAEKEEIGILVFDVTSAPASFIAEQSDLVRRFLAVTWAANEMWTRGENQQEMLAAIARESGMNEGDTAATLSSFRFPSIEEQLGAKWFGGGVQSFMRGLAGVFVEAGSMDSSLEDFDQTVNATLLRAIR